MPGLGVLRDGQKWVALAMPGYALAGSGGGRGAATTRPGRGHRGRVLRGAGGDAARSGVGRRRPGDTGAVPAGMGTPRPRSSTPIPRPVAVLPVDSMRSFAWAGDAPVLDPLPRWVRADVLTTGDLTIAGRTVPGEGARAREVQRLLVSGADREQLAAAGVGWVVVEGRRGPDSGAAGRLPRRRSDRLRRRRGHTRVAAPCRHAGRPRGVVGPVGFGLIGMLVFGCVDGRLRPRTPPARRGRRATAPPRRRRRR